MDAPCPRARRAIFSGSNTRSAWTRNRGAAHVFARVLAPAGRYSRFTTRPRASSCASCRGRCAHRPLLPLLVHGLTGRERSRRSRPHVRLGIPDRLLGLVLSDVRRGVRRLLVLPLGLLRTRRSAHLRVRPEVPAGRDDRAAGALRSHRPLRSTSPSSAAPARGAPACTARSAGTEGCADHQPQVGRREGEALQPAGGGEEAQHRALAARAG